MIFCKECDNMYYIQLDESQNSLIYYCRNCGFQEEKSESHVVVSKTNFKRRNDHTFINRYTHLDPTIPRINSISCKNKECDSNNNVDTQPDILYMRYNHNSLKYIYLCSICQTSWTNEHN
jgi:DNA-directed RNA polymerase subunit M/transcription elongation factor TFIIS